MFVSGVALLCACTAYYDMPHGRFIGVKEVVEPDGSPRVETIVERLPDGGLLVWGVERLDMDVVTAAEYEELQVEGALSWQKPLMAVVSVGIRPLLVAMLSKPAGQIVVEPQMFKEPKIRVMVTDHPSGIGAFFDFLNPFTPFPMGHSCGLTSDGRAKVDEYARSIGIDPRNRTMKKGRHPYGTTSIGQINWFDIPGSDNSWLTCKFSSGKGKKKRSKKLRSGGNHFEGVPRPFPSRKTVTRNVSHSFSRVRVCGKWLSARELEGVHGKFRIAPNRLEELGCERPEAVAVERKLEDGRVKIEIARVVEVAS